MPRAKRQDFKTHKLGVGKAKKNVGVSEGGDSTNIFNHIKFGGTVLSPQQHYKRKHGGNRVRSVSPPLGGAQVAGVRGHLYTRGCHPSREGDISTLNPRQSCQRIPPEKDNSDGFGDLFGSLDYPERPVGKKKRRQTGKGTRGWGSGPEEGEREQKKC